ncbi:hypothetical protein VPNG_10017 [Cytospora leucostoma]|uniref:Uncharacterized protein n=1 Tax=Cytospora leucostoma TaxID=1230097 RepID=A0A423VH93_9PEZI|nr:hypothetical protein VPNG_10017 [Cytospora leucostoma]
MAAHTIVVDGAAVDELWRHELTREILEDADEVESHVPSILLHLLATYPGDDPEAAREAAREAAFRIDGDYRDVYLPSDPLLQGQDDKGMAGFLDRLYDLMLRIARLVKYDDIRQHALIQCLGELRKLPPKAFRIWNEDCLVYTREPVFAVTTEDGWNANFRMTDSPS